MDYILDTNILVYWIRKHPQLSQYLIDLASNPQCQLYISVVSAGEILSLSY